MGRKTVISNVRIYTGTGKIIERGNHDTLIKQKGVYYQLYTGAFELEQAFRLLVIIP